MKANDPRYDAMLSRDPRFDGRFFVGVKTTGIYCRPVCPARPKRANAVFFESSLAAERAGYRPCLRCRPESAPGSPAWTGTSALVSRALKRIAMGERIAADDEAFAAKFGVSARHLRRLFEKEVGKSPKRIADEQRLGFARQLVVETDLPFTRVAEAAGYKSLRRFNSSFKDRFARSPTELRRKRKARGDDGWVEIALNYRPPFDFASVLDFHRRHAIAGLEDVGTESYRRVAVIERAVVVFEVSQKKAANALRLRTRACDVAHLFTISRRVRRMFDLDSDPLAIESTLMKVPRLKRLVKRRPGLRVASGFDPHETAFMTILGQLVSVERANQLVASLLRNYGKAIEHPVSGETIHAFPSAEVIAASDLAAIGTTTARKRALRALAREIASGRLDLEEAHDVDVIKVKLLAIPGIGPWTSEYVALRALGDVDSFPGADLILKRATSGENAIDLSPIRPWRSYAAIHFWKEHA